MKYKNNRPIELAKYMISTNKTIRQIAVDYNLSKSTIHNDLSYKLKTYDYNLYIRVKKILLFHDKVKHINGGKATKEKYNILKLKNCCDIIRKEK